MVIRSLHETLQYVIDSPKGISTVLDVMASLSTNNEPVLRTDLMEQVPQIAFLCHDHPDKLGGLVTSNLVPMVVKFLTDANDLVRKTSQAALLVLLEQELVSHNDVHDQVCPVILDLTEVDAIDYYKTEAVALMSKMAPLVGREMTESLFLQRFMRLCSDTLFQVRKVCAANFGEFSGVVGTDGTENVLLPHFLNLCEDGVWGVRKACADVFMAVSCACSLETRKTRLSPLFVSLLTDECRWVRLAAFQNLGPFISTFADPSVTGLHYNDEGVLYIGPSPKDHDAPPLDADTVLNPENSQRKAGDDPLSTPREEWYSSEWLSGRTPKLDTSIQIVNSAFEAPQGLTGEDTSVPRERDVVPRVVTETAPDDPSYNELNYWRIPLPDLDLVDVELEVGGNLVNVEEQLQPSSSVPHDNESTTSATTSTCQPSNEEDVEEIVTEVNHLDSYFSTTTYRHAPTPMADTTTDDVQAELEALAASLAESIFCNDPTITATPDVNPFGRRHLADHPTSTTTTSITAEETDGEESQTSTSITPPHSVASSCAPCPSLHPLGHDAPFATEENMGSREMSEVAPSSSPTGEHLDEDMFVMTSIFHDTGEHVEEGGGTLFPSAEEEKPEEDEGENQSLSTAQEGEPTEELQSLFLGGDSGSGSLMGQFDYSKGLHNLTSFSNLTALTAGGRPIDGAGNPARKRIFDSWSPAKLRSYRDAQQHRSSISINTSQDIVPKMLLEHYIGMTDPARAETVDDEITRHCAYSLPAVALTLGRRYWSLLRETYETLASDMHWKVRRTLAFSIHELALILGEELAQKDLLPVFEGFIKDLDEVRIGVLKHLAHFLKMLPQAQRKMFLPRLNEFLNPDNVNNWRFRLELALQLSPIAELFTPQECWTHICPITLNLMTDKVVEIRRTCFIVVSQLARKLMMETEESLVLPLSLQLIEEFAQANTWTRRQSYVYAVGQILKDSALPLPVVSSLLLPKFLDLSYDKVPNIRLVIAKIINSTIITLDYYQAPENECVASVRETLARLQNDPDRDVQYFASYPVHTEIPELQDPGFY